MLRLLKAYRGPARPWQSLPQPLETPGLASCPLGPSPANGQTNWDVLSPFIPRCRAWQRAFLPSAARYSGEISSSIWIWLPLAQARFFARIFHGGNIAKRLCAGRCANARRRRDSCRDRRFCLKRPAGRRGRRNIFTGRNRRCSPLCRAFFPVRRGKSCRPAGKCIAETRSSPCVLASRLPKFYAELRRGVLPRAPWQVCKENTVQTSTPFFARSRRPRARDRRDSLLVDDAIRRASSRTHNTPRRTCPIQKRKRSARDRNMNPSGFLTKGPSSRCSGKDKQTCKSICRRCSSPAMRGERMRHATCPPGRTRAPAIDAAIGNAFRKKGGRPRTRDRHDSLLMDNAIRRAFQRHR